MTEAVAENEENIPQRWLDLDIDHLVKQGWRPRFKKKADDGEYISIRHGNKERSLGPATEENLTILAKNFPKIYALLMNPRSQAVNPKEKADKILSTKVARPAVLGSTLRLSLTTLQWFTYCKEVLGYPGDLGIWVNSIVDEYFSKYQNLEFAVVIGKN